MKYGYEEASYVSHETKVRIRCKKHGCFEQKPSAHLSGKGCPSCGGSKKLTTPEFISRAVRTHGNRYDYSEAEYTGIKTKVKIISKNTAVFIRSLAGIWEETAALSAG